MDLRILPEIKRMNCLLITNAVNYVMSNIVLIILTIARVLHWPLCYFITSFTHALNYKI